MSDLDPAVFNLDQRGEPVGVWRPNKDTAPDRVHEVPALNRAGQPITERVPVRDENGNHELDADGGPKYEERVVMETLPLDHPRVTAALAEYGLYVEDGGIIVGVDRAQVDEWEAAVAAQPGEGAALVETE
jgi:hypothetical protein